MNEKVEALLLKAQKFLQSAAVLLELGDFDSCASRAYFAMFYAAQASLLHSGQRPSESRGIRTAFVRTFVDSGQLPERAGKAFSQAAEMQEVGDYAHDFAVNQEEAERTLQEAEAFVNSIDRLIESSAER